MKKRIAVVAVHGVGSPAPGDTARSIAALLLRLEDGPSKRSYSRLKEELITFPAGELPKAAGNVNLLPRDRQREKLFFGWRKQYPTQGSNFIHEQLNGFKPQEDDETYQTVRIKTERCCDGAQVDVHEVHWSDVTRRGKGFLRLFIELYQLLFHLSLLSEKTILAHYFSMPKEARTPSWAALRFFVFAASRYLTRVLVLYNLWLITPAVFYVVCYLPLNDAGFLPPLWEPLCGGIAGLGVIFAMAAGVLMETKSGSKQLVTILWAIFGVLLLLAAAMYGQTLHLGGDVPAILVPHLGGLTTQRFMCAATGFIVAVAGGTGLTFLFNRYHPNSENLGALVGGCLAGAYAYCCGLPTDETSFCDDFFILATLGFMLNIIIVILLQLMVFVAGVAALKKDLFKVTLPSTRAFVTAILGLAAPTILITIITVTLWSLFNICTLQLDKTHEVNRLPDILLGLGTTGSSGMVVVFGEALLVGFLLLLPTIIVEVATPKLNLDSSRRLGTWLTFAGQFVNILAIALFLAAIFPIVSQVLTLWFGFKNSDNWAPLAVGPSGSSVVAVLIGSGGILILFLKNYLEDWTTAFLPILERVLDVDEYLRESPDGYTAKARIFNRVHALMRGLTTDCGDGNEYDKIIILAHSQGAVISADYLHYLHDLQQSWQLPIALFTMGNPLRQLYGWRFPTWYDWAWAGPTTAQLAVQSWSNAYGAGDGVGRSQWRDPSNPTTYDVNLNRAIYWRRNYSNGDWLPGSQGRRETCIGNTGHVHYWDTFNNLGSEVAVELDRLI